jgi:hypothetical protein
VSTTSFTSAPHTADPPHSAVPDDADLPVVGRRHPWRWVGVFVLVPHLTPGGLDDFVDRVVPILRDRGVFRFQYAGTTLRGHLGLDA